MKVNKEKAIEAQNKSCNMLKEKFDTGDKDELPYNTAARTSMKKSNVVCVICIKKLAMKKWLNKFI